MIRTVSAAALAVFTLTTPLAVALEGTWVCEKKGDMDKDEAWEISPNIAMFRIVNEYRARWDAEYVRRQCEAFAAGESYEISCLNDRRDWEAIKAMVPSEYFGMSNPELTPHYQALQMSDDGFKDAIGYCRSVGAVK
jgi:hypothetical protein